MAFSIDKFNQGINYDVAANLGKLTFLGLEKRPVFEDGVRTEKEEITHVIVFSEKMNDNVQLKLPEGGTYKELPFMSEIRVIGKASPFIYNFESKVGFGDNAQEIWDLGVSLRIDGYEQAGAKQEQPKQEHK